MQREIASKALPPVQAGEWWFTAKAVSFGGVMAWCAKTPNLKDGPLQLPWDVEVHFEFGETAEEAIRKLKLEVRVLS